MGLKPHTPGALTHVPRIIAISSLYSLTYTTLYSDTQVFKLYIFLLPNFKHLKVIGDLVSFFLFRSRREKT